MEESQRAKEGRSLAEKITLDTRPEVAVKNYFQSKFGEKLVKKKPEWDAPRITPTTELVEARRDVVQAQKALENKRDENKKKRREIDKEWRDLERKEMNLHESYGKFNKFVKENQAKRDRAEKRIAEEQEIQGKKDADIKEMQEKVDWMKKIKDDMQRHVEKYSIYEQFLHQVITQSTELKTINDILNRYETLSSARNDLAARQQADLFALENARNEMIKLTEEKSQIMLGLNNNLADLEARYQKARADAAKWEAAVKKIKDISAEKALELDQVSISCWSLYTSMSARKNVAVEIDKSDVENQLVFIKQTIQELKPIIKQVYKRVNKEIASSKRNSSRGHTRKF